jgi:hypothetical protein
MTEATLTLAALEATAMLKLTALDNDRPKVAYAAVAENSITAKQRWQVLDDEADRSSSVFVYLMPRSSRRASVPCTRTGVSSGKP